MSNSLFQKSLFKYYRYSVSFILLLTAAAKLISTGADVRILHQYDPIFGIEFIYLMWIASTIETIVAFICLLKIAEWIQAVAIALLAANFVFYRMGLWWIDYQQPCTCLGRLSDGLHLSPHVASMILRAIIAYLLVGSFIKLFALWKFSVQPLSKASPL